MKLQCRDGKHSVSHTGIFCLTHTLLHVVQNNANIHRWSCPGSVSAMKSALRSCMFLCVATTLCLESGCGTQPLKDRINSAPRREDKRTPAERELQERKLDQIVQGLQRAADPQGRNAGRPGMGYYILFLAAGAAVIGGLVYWNLWRLKQLEWRLIDPMALAQELFLIHQLTEPEKRVMRDVSEKNALPTPLQLFVEPKFLLDALDNDSLALYRNTIRRLLSKLFDIIIEGGETSTVVSGLNLPGINSETLAVSGENSGASRSLPSP